MTNAEFVNLYVENQKKLIDEFQSKIILLETNMQFKDLAIEEANNKLVDNTNRLETALAELTEKYESQAANYSEEVKFFNKSQHELNTTIDLLMRKIEEREQETDYYRKVAADTELNMSKIENELNTLKESLANIDKSGKKIPKR